MTNREKLLAKDLQEFNRRYYGRTIRGSMKDYITVYRDFCRGDYSLAQKTKLYKNRGGEYCSLLEILSAHYKDHQKRTA